MSNTLDKRMNIVALTWPIFVETLLRTALNTSDVFMLSGYSDLAVSAVGVVSPISFFFIVISMMVSTGTGILIAQYNGAKRLLESSQVGTASFILGGVAGLLLSLLSFLFAADVIQLYGVEPDVADFAYDYLIISGSLTIFVTLGVVFSTILRSHGHSKPSMYINLICGVINVIGNYCVLYEPFGLPVYGVTGVATATVISQAIGAVALWLMLVHYQIAPQPSKMFEVPKRIYKKILHIGVMNGGEILSYNLYQMVLVYFVVSMGTHSLTAFTYAQNIGRVTFAFAIALGQGSQIQTSYFVGKGLVEGILLKVNRYFWIGFFASTSIAGLFYLFKTPIIGLFTEDPTVVLLVAQLMLVSIFLEGGRVFNLIFISSLKGAGDIKFPVQLGIFNMWVVGVGMALIFSHFTGLGVIGILLAVAIEEWVRGLIAARRWNKKSWQRFALI
jgi:putative MATE family efflux protein